VPARRRAVEQRLVTPYAVSRHIERLCAETVLELNDAMCDYYNRPVGEGGCGRAGSEGLPA